MCAERMESQGKKSKDIGNWMGRRKEMKANLPGKGRRQRCIYKYVPGLKWSLLNAAGTQSEAALQ